MPAVGETIGPYQLLKILGSGGQGTVFLAERVGSELISTRLAIKLLPAFPEQGDHAERRFQDFRHEAWLLTRMHHPHIVTVFEVTRLNGYPALVMEFVEGESLEAKISRRIQEQRPFGVSRALRLITQAAAALHYAHTLPGDDGTPLQVVHRDVKPGNILMLGDGSVKLTDFGLARSESDIHRTTEQGILKGTVKFMCPEQVASDPVGPTSDLYSLGIVLYEMVTLDNPYGIGPHAGVTTWLLGIQRGEIQVQQHLEKMAGWCEPLATLLSRMLKYDPEQRFPSSLKLLEELYRISRLIDEGVICPPEQVPPPPVPRADSLMAGRPPELDASAVALTLPMGPASLVELASARSAGPRTALKEAPTGVLPSTPVESVPLPPVVESRWKVATPWVGMVLMGGVALYLGFRDKAPPDVSPEVAPTLAPLEEVTDSLAATPRVEATALVVETPAPRPVTAPVRGKTPGVVSAPTLAPPTPAPTPTSVSSAVARGQLKLSGVPSALIQIGDISWGEASVMDPLRLDLDPGTFTLVGKDGVTGEVVFRQRLTLAPGGHLSCRWDGGERWQWDHGRATLKVMNCLEE